ncbi:MAG TPA: ATP-binding protein [Opitutales bacterium]|nr:ATP-binding protein [Opitutales bacterium]
MIELASYFALFYCLQQIGLLFATDHINASITPVRPAAGVTLAIILWRGYRFWPAMVLTGIISQYQVSHNWGQSLILPMGGTICGLIGVWLVRRYVGRRIDFGSIRSVLGFLWWGAVVRAVLISTWSVGSLLVLGLINREQFPLAWITNFVGIAMGVAVFGSFVLNWVQPSTMGEGEATWSETLLLYFLLIVATMGDYLSEMPLTFLPFPLLVWAGLRLEARALTTATVILVLTALGCLMKGYTPFGLTREDPDQLLVVLQVFIVCAAGTAMVLGAVAAQRRRTLRASAELSSFQKAVLDGTNFSIIVTDNAGVITSVNRGSERLLGYSEKDLLGKTPEFLHDPVEITARAAELTQLTGKLVRGYETLVARPRCGEADEREWTYIRKDGSRVPVFLSVTPLHPVRGRVRGFLGMAVDITSRKQAEFQMQAAKTAAEQANRAKSEFLANISHEIRTPMNSILGFAELLQRHLRDPAMKKQALAIFSSGQTLLQLINDLLDLSKVEAGRLELQPGPVDIQALAQEMKQFFSLKAEEKNIAIILQLQGMVDGQFELDEVRVRQILFNLIGNALKFTDHGHVVLTIEVEADAATRSRLHFEVRDTGVGIPIEQLQRLFLPFEQRAGQSTRKYGGTGLGLSISRRLAELMGGTLLASSEVGVGSVFRLTIPSVVHTPAHPSIKQAPPQPAILLDQMPSGNHADTENTAKHTPAALAAWQRCAEQAAGAWMVTWETLLQAPLFDDVEQFGRLLANACGEETPEILRAYGHRLVDQARDFEVEEMTHSLREFPQLARRLSRGPTAGRDAIALDAGI